MGIETIILGALSVGMSAMQASAQNSALEDANRAAGEQADLEIAELNRQREFVDEEAALQKSARVRESDRMHASMLVGMADMGGAGGVNAERLSQEVGFYEGIDIARLEGNRVRQSESLKAKQQFAKNKAINIGTQNKAEAKNNTYKFLSSAVKTGASAFGPGSLSGGGGTGSIGKAPGAGSAWGAGGWP